MIYIMNFFNECSRGRGLGGKRGLGGSPMEGMFVEMDRGWEWGSDTWKKTINVRIVKTQICLRICTG